MKRTVYSALYIAGVVAMLGAPSCTPARTSAARQGDAPSTQTSGSTQKSEVTLSGTPAERRAAVLEAGGRGEAGLPILRAAMHDPSVLVRRTAVRVLGEIGQPAVEVLTVAAADDVDPLVRRTALREVVRLQGDQAMPALSAAMDDKDPMVRQTAVEALGEFQPRTEAMTQLLRRGQQDADVGVSQIANAILWPFHKKAESVTQQPGFKDNQLTVLLSIPLPEDGWKFQTDPNQTGQISKWYEVDFNDSAWGNIKIGEVWEDQGHAAYDGAAWYRRTITLPAKPQGAVGADLVCDAVDESAWIWVNGQYVGDHDIGVMGWDKPFSADISDVVKWGQENQITIRVLDRGMAGGIWRPVHVDVFKR